MNYIFIALIIAFLSCTKLLSQVEKIEWRGWQECYRISNKHCEVIIGTSCGGRVLSFSLDGKNIIFEDASFNGKTLNDWKIKSFDPDAGRFDYGPERKTQSIHSLSWVGQWRAEIIDDQTLRLTSARDTSLGLQSLREFHLNMDSAVLTITLIGTNITKNPIVRHFWGRTLVKPGGTMILPINPKSRFEHSWGQFLWGPDRIVSPEIRDDRIQLQSKSFRFHCVGATIKAGTDATDGWMAYAFDGLLFVKRFTAYPDQDYSGSNNMPVIFFSNGKFAEMEPCSPTYTIQPNSHISFSERWELEAVPSYAISDEMIFKYVH